MHPAFYIVCAVLWLVWAIITAVIAHHKGRSAVGWFFIGLIFGLIGVIWISCLRSASYVSDTKPYASTPSSYLPYPSWVCPNCGAYNDADSKFCKECGANKAEEKKWVCERCTKENDEDSKFCPDCGLSKKESEEMRENRTKEPPAKETSQALNSIEFKSKDVTINKSSVEINENEYGFVLASSCDWDGANKASLVVDDTNIIIEFPNVKEAYDFFCDVKLAIMLNRK